MNTVFRRCLSLPRSQCQFRRFTTLAICLSMAVFFLPDSGFTQQKNETWIRFYHPDRKFQISSPPGFGEIRGKDTPAEMILGPEKGGFPVITILEVPGTFPIHKEEADIADLVTHSYNQVGLQNASATKVEKIDREAAAKYLQVQMNYTLDNKAMSAFAAFFNGKARHFVITCIVLEEALQESGEVCENIIASFESPLIDRVVGETVKEEKGYSYVLYGFLFVLLLMVLFIGLRNRESHE